MIRNDAGYRLHQMCLAVARLLVITGILLLVGAASAQREAGIGLTPEETVTRLMSAVSQGSEQDIEELVAALWGLGETAIPAIGVGISQGDDLQRVQLVRALGGIGGDSSTSLLLEVVAQRTFPRAAARALSALENRVIRRALALEELRALTDEVGQDNIVKAGHASRVLAGCTEVPATDRLKPIITRFKKELVSPSIVGKILGSYLSPRVYVRNQFLLAFSDIGDAGTPALEQEHRASVENSAIEKWWVLALGFVGDTSVAADLEEMVMTEPDRYIRSLAMRAYARSAKQDAIPLLESLLTDTTESEYATCTGETVLVIQLVAKDELVRLESEETSKR